jgi:tRNA modification GTPase
MALPPLHDTIAAIATAPGMGAIGVVRLSGPGSFQLAEGIFAAKQRLSALPGGRVIYGQIRDGSELIDEALLLTFRAPRSYTAQDVIELQTHGGPAVLRAVLALCLRRGARLAGPGEFTLRAYLNGRIDLVQAEAVLDLVMAQSDQARRNANLGLNQALSRELDQIQSDITGLYGNLQAVLDYPEEGVPESEFAAPLRQTIARCERLLATARAGAMVRRGARLAIAGRPNVGKSSLLNALLGYPRSIVSELPGTTRDYLEAPLELDGVPITAIDTAGIRTTTDTIEAIGVSTAKEIAAAADLTILLLDGSTPLTTDDRLLLAELRPEQTLLVINKCDLPPAWPPAALGAAALPVSATRGSGLAELKQAVRERLIGEAAGSELWLTSERHAAALTRAKEALTRALNAPDDLAAIDLEEGLQALAEITGRGEIAEEALAYIFQQFCVGK